MTLGGHVDLAVERKSTPAAQEAGVRENMVAYRLKPPTSLAGLIAGAGIYHAGGGVGQVAVDWLLPGPAQICVMLGGGPMTAMIGARRFDPVPSVALCGPTSQVVRVQTQGGRVLSLGLTAQAWARLTRHSASTAHNRFMPLHAILPTGAAATLAEAMVVAATGSDPMDTIEAALAPLLAVPHDDEPMITALIAVLNEGGHHSASAVAEQLGMSEHTLRRIAVRYFGMTPKLLLMRVRFLRAFVRLFVLGPNGKYDPLEDGYFDVPHFLRDARYFLGMTPRQFMAMPTPFLDAVLRNR